jgi:hypothetical protein
MATTTNYSWTTPDDTDLVKDGASAIRTLGSSVDTTVKALSPGTTAGDIDYYTTSTAKARVAIGTAGQVLQVNSGATAPEWATPAPGGGMTLINETSASALSSISYTSLGSYKQLLLVWSGLRHSTTGSAFDIRFNNDSSSLYVRTSFSITAGSTTQAQDATTSAANISTGYFFGENVTGANEIFDCTGYLYLDNYTSATKNKSYYGQVFYRYQTGPNNYFTNLLGYYNSTSAITTLDIVRLSGSATFTNQNNTTIRLYGIQ